MKPFGFRACGQPMALVSVELNIGLRPVASLVGKLNPWLQAERSQGRQLKWISLCFPGTWLHAQFSPAVCRSSRSPGKLRTSSSYEPFSMQPQLSAATWPLSLVACVWQGDGKGPVQPGCLSLALKAVKGEPNTLLKPYSLQNTDRKGKDPPYSFRFWKARCLQSWLCFAVYASWMWSTYPGLKPSLPVCQREELVNVKFSRKITAGPWP